MKELSLNILDIAMNSVKAGSTLIGIYIDESDELLTIRITDNGCGMTAEQVRKLTDPFYTTRTTRKVGLGVPFFSLAAEQTGGNVTVTSRPQSEHPDAHGTEVTAVFYKKHIDFTPLGDVTESLLTLIQGYPDVDFDFEHRFPSGTVKLSTKELRDTLGDDIPLSSFEILAWIKQYMADQYHQYTEERV